LVGAVRHDNVLLIRVGFPHNDPRVLDQGGAVPENEIHRAGDFAVAVELTMRVGVQRVLVPVHGAVEEGRPITLHAQRHCLVFHRAGSVLKRHRLCNETFCNRRCKHSSHINNTPFSHVLSYLARIFTSH